MRLYQFLLSICSFLIRILYRVKIQGNPKLEEEKAYIIASNHASYLDPVVLAMAFSGHHIHFLGKKELFKKGIFDRIFTTIGVIPVDRKKNDITAVKNVLRLLKNKGILGIFPQGTRIRGTEEDQSKAGLGMFAVKTATDIIPVTIRSSYKFFSPIEVIIHEVYPISETTEKNGTQTYLNIANEVMNIIKGREE